LIGSFLSLAVETGHPLRTVARTGYGAQRDRALDLRQIAGRQPEVQRAQRLGELIPAARPHNGDDIRNKRKE
jgi:hypothetical protein